MCQREARLDNQSGFEILYGCLILALEGIREAAIAEGFVGVRFDGQRTGEIRNGFVILTLVCIRKTTVKKSSAQGFTSTLSFIYTSLRKIIAQTEGGSQAA